MIKFNTPLLPINCIQITICIKIGCKKKKKTIKLTLIFSGNYNSKLFKISYGWTLLNNPIQNLMQYRGYSMKVKVSK